MSTASAGALAAGGNGRDGLEPTSTIFTKTLFLLYSEGFGRAIFLIIVNRVGLWIGGETSRFMISLGKWPMGLPLYCTCTPYTL